jgi:hypothetical protein
MTFNFVSTYFRGRIRFVLVPYRCAGLAKSGTRAGLTVGSNACLLVGLAKLKKKISNSSRKCSITMERGTELAKSSPFRNQKKKLGTPRRAFCKLSREAKKNTLGLNVMYKCI